MIIINLLFSLGVMVFAVSYLLNAIMITKTIASSLFVILAVINIVYLSKTNKKHIKFAVLMLMALVFSLFADLTINHHFIGGALIFAVAHVFYLISFCSLEKFRLRNLLYSLPFLAVCIILICFLPNLNTAVMVTVAVIYSIIISFMTGKSLSNLRLSYNSLYILLFTAGIIFFFSDVMLVLGHFADMEIPRALCRFSYYFSQCLMAMSIYKAKN